MAERPAPWPAAEPPPPGWLPAPADAPPPVPAAVFSGLPARPVYREPHPVGLKNLARGGMHACQRLDRRTGAEHPG